MTAHRIPKMLQTFFFLHFAVDMATAIPLFINPGILHRLGWQVVDPVATRAVAAALFGIGIESYLCHKSTLQVYYSLLRLKVVWSFFALMAATIGLWKMGQAAPWGLYVMFVTFLVFHMLWDYWLLRVRKMLGRAHL